MRQFTKLHFGPPVRQAILDRYQLVAGIAQMDKPFSVQVTGSIVEQLNAALVGGDQVVISSDYRTYCYLLIERRNMYFDQSQIAPTYAFHSSTTDYRTNS